MPNTTPNILWEERTYPSDARGIPRIKDRTSLGFLEAPTGDLEVRLTNAAGVHTYTIARHNITNIIAALVEVLH